MSDTAPSDSSTSALLPASHYFVAFVDLLGESNRLAAINSIPKSEAEKIANLRATAEAASVVRNVRNSFAEFFKERPIEPGVLEQHPVERREEFASIIRRKAVQIGFSDSFTISIPLTPVPKETPFVALARGAYDMSMALLGLGTLSLAALQQGIPLRAGIDIGLGTEMFPNEIYGPALLSAYRLECTVAEYPRTVFGETFFAYLCYLEDLPKEVILNEFTAKMVARCREFSCPAPDDGWPMLHYLSPVVMAAPGDFVKARKEAENWVRGELARYGKERNEKLYRRYVRLSRYFDTYKQQ
jgi:hypothetical protein